MFSFFAKKSFDQRPCYFWLLCHETPKKVFCYKLLKRMKSCYVHTTFKIHLLCHERHSILTSHNVKFEFAYFLTTVCKLQDFPVTQILREIKIDESSLKVCHSVITLPKFWASMAKTAILEPLDSPKLISRKTWMTEKS